MHEDKINETIASLILKDSYWGYLFSNIERKRISFKNFPAKLFAVYLDENGEIFLLYDEDDLKNTDIKVIEKVLEHEGYHILNKHLLRLETIIKEYSDNEKDMVVDCWQKASDFCANYLCNMPRIVKINNKDFYPLFSDLYKLPNNLSSEEYFYRLYTNNKDKNNLNNKEKQNEISNNVSCDSDNNFENVNNKSNNNNDDENHENKDNENNEQQYDDLKEEDIIKAEDMWVNSKMKVCPRFIETKINDLVYNAYRQVREKGNLSSSVKELIDDILRPPKIPYYNIIRKIVKGNIKAKETFAYSKINKKRSYAFYFKPMLFLPFPGRQQNKTFSIVIILDTSGSMNKDKILEGLSGIKNFIENDKYCKITVIENDIKIQKEYTIKKIKDIQFDIKGRGGTYLFPSLERSLELKSDITLVFTDAECENLNEFDRKLLPKKIIYIIPENNSDELINKTGYVVKIDY